MAMSMVCRLSYGINSVERGAWVKELALGVMRDCLQCFILLSAKRKS